MVVEASRKELLLAKKREGPDKESMENVDLQIVQRIQTIEAKDLNVVMSYGGLGPMIALSQRIPTVQLRNARENLPELIEGPRVHYQIDIGMWGTLVRPVKRR